MFGAVFVAVFLAVEPPLAGIFEGPCPQAATAMISMADVSNLSRMDLLALSPTRDEYVLLKIAESGYLGN
jgi:hypothetical protein